MEDGNLKLYVLKIILKKKVFDRVKKIETYFANQSYQAQKNIKDLISRIEHIQDMNDSVVENAIKSMYKSSKADEMSRLCIAIGNNPSEHSFKEVQRFLETIDEEYFDTIDDTSVTKDVDEIIEAVNQQREFKFNIHALQNATEGIGKGNFMIVFARPESGKTAFWVSMVANEGGFAWQKKNVHIFCNEEPAIRTQMRMLNACSNLTKRQILNGSRQLAKDKWQEIQSYIYTHDSVDMNMEDLNTYCKEHDVDILIIDQLDKVNVTGKYNSSHEKLGEVYRQAREIAKNLNLNVADKPDSQDICFVPNGDYASVIQKFRPDSFKKGNIKNLQGKVIGVHDGIVNFTIGQRKGIKISNDEPLYVVKINSDKNEIIVGPREFLGKKEILLKDVNLLSEQQEFEKNIYVKVRSTGKLLGAKVKLAKNNSANVELDIPEDGISPGQACVFYNKDLQGYKVLGGGWIKE